MECDLKMILAILVICFTSFSSICTEGLFYSLFLILKLQLYLLYKLVTLKAHLDKQHWVRGEFIVSFCFLPPSFPSFPVCQ